MVARLVEEPSDKLCRVANSKLKQRKMARMEQSVASEFAAGYLGSQICRCIPIGSTLVWEKYTLLWLIAWHKVDFDRRTPSARLIVAPHQPLDDMSNPRLCTSLFGIVDRRICLTISKLGKPQGRRRPSSHLHAYPSTWALRRSQILYFTS